MAYHGFMRVGGVDVVNTERARGYLTTSDCPRYPIREQECSTIAEAMGDGSYSYDDIESAPWYDPSLPDVSGRFFGVVGHQFESINNSTRQASRSEGVTDGGVIGRVRKGMRGTRVRATIIANGGDALEYGENWLNTVFDGTCSQHGDICGTTDLEFLAACPPERGMVMEYTPWVESARNYVLNPSFEGANNNADLYNNLFRDPDMVNLATWSATAGAATLGPGNTLVVTSTGNSAVRLGVAQLLDTKYPAGTYVASVDMQGADPSLTTARVILLDTNGSAIRATTSITKKSTGMDRYDFTLTATGEWDRIYVEFTGTAIPTGAVVNLGRPIVGLRSIVVPFFSPAQGVPNSDLSAVWGSTPNASYSILRGLRPSGVNTSSSSAYLYRSSEWSDTGAYSVKVDPNGANNSAYGSIIVNGLTAGATYTAIAKVRLAAAQTGTLNSNWQRQIMAQSTGMPVNNVVSNRAPNAPGVYEVRVTFTLGASTSLTLFLMNGSISTPVWFDSFAVIPGVYDGTYFSGATQDTELARHTWSGAADASVSVLETRQEAPRPQTDDEYAKTVDGYRRYLHDIAVISGPIEVGKFRFPNSDLWGKTLEWTISSERAWVYGAKKDIVLNPTVPSIVQDVPYNLLPYPSAEIGEGAVTQWLQATGPAASTYVVVPTFVNPPGGQSTHPSVVDFGGTTFGGYRYWMASTPYPAGNDAHEDPSIVASTNGTTWVTPAGLTNPIDNQPGSPGAYNSDVDLVVGPDAKLWLFWRTYDPAATGAEEKLYVSTSANGVVWSPKTLIWQTAASSMRLLSPSFIFENGFWTMYAINVVPSTPTLVRVRSTEALNLTPSTWGGTTICSVTPALPAGRQMWHIEVRVIDGQYLALLNDCTAGASGSNGDLYMMRSVDGLAFTRATTVAIPRTGTYHTALYRATLVKRTDTTLDVWYSGWTTGPVVWNIFRTTLTAPAVGTNVTVSTNLSTNPSVETDASGWAFNASVVSGTAPAAFTTAARSTELAAAGGIASYRVRLLGDNGATAVSAAVANLAAYQDVTIPAGTGRVSFNMWGALLAITGSSPGTVLTSLAYSYYFVDGGGATIGTEVTFGTATVAEFSGKAFSARGVLVPAGAAKVRVLARARVTWTSSATAGQNSDIRLYADALTVSVP